MNCSEIRPQLEAYALDALDLYTRAHVETHLQTCAQCRVALVSLRSAVAQLPFALGSASPLRPPASLKEKLMRSVQADLEGQAQSQATQNVVTARTARPAPTAQRGRWLLNPRVWMASLATSMLIIVALFAWNMTSNQKVRQAQAKIDRIQDQQALAVPVLNSQTAQEIVLTSPDNSTPAYAKVVLDPKKPTVVFIGYDLPQLSPDYEYVLWTIDRGVIQARGSFTPNRDGFAMLVFLADRNDPLLKQISVTRQRTTELVPSTDRVLVWRANPNDLSNDFAFDSIFPPPTLSHVER